MIHLHAVHGHRGQVVGVLFVPAETKQWVVLGVFIDDGAVLQMSQVKHADGSVGPHGSKHVSAPSCTAESDVIHLQRQEEVENSSVQTNTNPFYNQDKHRPLCRERLAGSSRAQTPGLLVLTPDLSPGPR